MWAAQIFFPGNPMLVAKVDFINGDIFCFGLPCVTKVITIPEPTKLDPPSMMAFFFEVVHGKSTAFFFVFGVRRQLR